MAHVIVINCRMLQHPDTGLGNYTARLIKGLARHAPNWKLICLVPDNVIFEFPSSCEKVILKQPRIHRLLRDTWFDFVVDRHAARYHHDTILFHPMPVAYVTRPHATCMVYHDCITVHFPVYLGRKVIRRILSRMSDVAAKHCHIILTVSNHARQDIIDNKGIPPEKIHTVHNWLPPEYNPEKAHYDAIHVRHKYKLPSRFWLYIGGYDIRKNIEFLLHAYSMVKQKMSCPPMVLAGRIPASGAYAFCEVYKTMTDLHLQPGQEVILPGFIDSEDMPGLYGAAELLIYPSLYEGFGMPPMESMGCGCPVIAADNTSLPEIIKDRSYRFSTQSPEELINLLIRAALKTLPMNPSFSKRDFSEKTSISLLFFHLSKEAQQNR